MAKVLVNESSLTGIADAIRSKNGSTDTYKPSEMAAAITAISGGGPVIPDEAFVISGDCKYRFTNDGWTWFIEQYGDRITTQNITSCDYMFQYTKLETIPFDINLNLAPTSMTFVCDSMFLVSSVVNPPKINICSSSLYQGEKNKVFIRSLGTKYEREWGNQFIFVDDKTDIVGISYKMLENARIIKEEPTWLFNLINYDRARESNFNEFGGKFPTNYNNCYLLKEIPSLPKFWDNSNGYYNWKYGLNIAGCCSLQHITLPRPGTGTETANYWSTSKFDYTASLKNVLFDVQEDGTPYSANWKTQTIDLTAVGKGISSNTYTKYLDSSKCVIDYESYQQLKNDPAWWNGLNTSGFSYNYSPYNHDSAVETINSLPDTSVYLASKGGTNTIKFKGDAGSATDGGAINTLTEEEIAVATAKGWTVTLV